MIALDVRNKVLDRDIMDKISTRKVRGNLLGVAPNRLWVDRAGIDSLVYGMEATNNSLIIYKKEDKKIIAELAMPDGSPIKAERQLVSLEEIMDDTYVVGYLGTQSEAEQLNSCHSLVYGKQRSSPQPKSNVSDTIKRGWATDVKINLKIYKTSPKNTNYGYQALYLYVKGVPIEIAQIMGVSNLLIVDYIEKGKIPVITRHILKVRGSGSGYTRMTSGMPFVLGETPRLYNPITTNWRDDSARKHGSFCNILHWGSSLLIFNPVKYYHSAENSGKEGYFEGMATVLQYGASIERTFRGQVRKLSLPAIMLGEHGANLQVGNAHTGAMETAMHDIKF
jgi:hypothetical protein